MQDQDSWDPCPRGIVTELAGRLRQQRRRRRLRLLFGASALILLMLVAGWALTNQNSSAPRAGLNCRETVRLLADYHAKDLDAELANDVHEHLSRCPSCRKHYEEQFPSEVRNDSPDDPLIVASRSFFLR